MLSSKVGTLGDIHCGSLVNYAFPANLMREVVPKAIESIESEQLKYINLENTRSFSAKLYKVSSATRRRVNFRARGISRLIKTGSSPDSRIVILETLPALSIMRLQCASAIRQRPLVSRLNRIGQSRNYRVAILGGGITGLTSAWQLSRDPRCESVTILEKANRLGGWIDSERVPVNGGEVLFEYGPRTLRSAVPTSLPLLYLVCFRLDLLFLNVFERDD